MSKIRIYNDFEIKKLLSNKNVKTIRNCSQIIYQDEFKLWAVTKKLNYPYLTAKQIFQLAGFDTNMLSDSIPRRRINEWTKLYKKYGKEYFLNDSANIFLHKKETSGSEDIDFQSSFSANFFIRR